MRGNWYNLILNKLINNYFKVL